MLSLFLMLLNYHVQPSTAKSELHLQANQLNSLCGELKELSFIWIPSHLNICHVENSAHNFGNTISFKPVPSVEQLVNYSSRFLEPRQLFIFLSPVAPPAGDSQVKRLALRSLSAGAGRCGRNTTLNHSILNGFFNPTSDLYAIGQCQNEQYRHSNPLTRGTVGEAWRMTEERSYTYVYTYTYVHTHTPHTCIYLLIVLLENTLISAVDCASSLQNN